MVTGNHKPTYIHGGPTLQLAKNPQSNPKGPHKTIRPICVQDVQDSWYNMGPQTKRHVCWCINPSK